MLATQSALPRRLVPEPLESTGRGYPTEGHERSAAQKLVISQSNNLLGSYESLLKNISPNLNRDPAGAVQSLVEVTTRLNQATMSSMLDPSDATPERISQLKLVAESGVRFIEAHINQKLGPGAPEKSKIAEHADSLLQAIDDVVIQAEIDNLSVESSRLSADNAKDTRSSLGQSKVFDTKAKASNNTPQVQVEFDASDIEKSQEDGAIKDKSSSSNTQVNEELFEQLRGFVRNVKPHFTQESDQLSGALGQRTCDLHSVLFKSPSPHALAMRKIAARSAVVFVTHDYLTRAKPAPQQQQRVLGEAQRLLDAIDSMLTQPALRLGQRDTSTRKGPITWMKGLIP